MADGRRFRNHFLTITAAVDCSDFSEILHSEAK